MLRDPLQKPPVDLPKDPYGEPLLTRHGTIWNVTETKYGRSMRRENHSGSSSISIPRFRPGRQMTRPGPEKSASPARISLPPPLVCLGAAGLTAGRAANDLGPTLHAASQARGWSRAMSSQKSTGTTTQGRAAVDR